MLNKCIDFIAHNIGIFWTLGVVFVIVFGCERLAKLHEDSDGRRDCPAALMPLCLK